RGWSDLRGRSRPPKCAAWRQTRPREQAPYMWPSLRKEFQMSMKSKQFQKLSGPGTAKKHEPDCKWVPGAQRSNLERGYTKRRYELVAASTVTHVEHARCC